MNDEEIEKLIQKKGLSEKRVTFDLIESLIVDVTYTILPNKRSTVCQVNLINGYSVEGISTVISENYDEEVGRIAAYKKAIQEVGKVASVLLTEKLYQDNQAKNTNILKGQGQYFKHYKGGLYKLLHIAKRESDLEEIAVYQAVKDGVIYTRPLSEFYEKFTCVVGMDDKELARVNLQAEYDELLDRYRGLETKLSEGQPDNISDNQWWFIKRQLAPMREYHEVLTARIIDLDQSAE